MSDIYVALLEKRDKKPKKKKAESRKQAKKSKKDAESEDEPVEESDDLDEGEEVDYMSGSSRSSVLFILLHYAWILYLPFTVFFLCIFLRTGLLTVGLWMVFCPYNAVLVRVLSVGLCLCVCLSHAGIVLKRPQRSS